MATILCLETATTNCSVALSVNGIVIAIEEDSDKSYSHAEKLHLFIDNVCHKASIEKCELDAVAVSMGPGSYTGLRIGVSAAKGLCFALNIPLLAISTLQILSLSIESDSEYIVPMLDARRMEVYSAVFSKGKQIRDTKAEILTPVSFSDLLATGSVSFIGDGVEKFKSICTHSNAQFLMDKLPSSRNMAGLAEIKYKKNDIEDVAYFEPYYLKDFITN